MSSALAGPPPAAFEIKSANLPLVALLLRSPSLPELALALAERYGDLPDFFDHDPLVLDLGPLPPEAPVPDMPDLLSLLRGYRLAPVAVRGGPAAWREAALAAGLAWAPEAEPLRSATTTPAPQAEIQADGIRETSPPPLVPGASALVIDRPLRSGQQVYARGRDLVLLAMVNPGAEVIADGHIHAWAPLRGRAIAGARGLAEARILSQCLAPELVSIAGIYRTCETPLPGTGWGGPAQIRLSPGGEDGAGRLVMESLAA
jgi:septum site-determining protein MinC